MTDFECAAGCGHPLRRGQLAVVEERSDCFVPANRFRIWHYDCHPTVVDRRFWRLVRRAEAEADSAA
jgi:hypothetical protein